MNNHPIPTASPCSVEGYMLARELVRFCPPDLAQEIAITGSVSRGVADEYSDVELNFWTQQPTNLAERIAWLQQAGATDFWPRPDVGDDDTMWTTFHYQGRMMQAGWQTIAAHEQHLQSIIAGKVMSYGIITAEATASALPLRTDGKLAAWQGWLADYPHELAATLIADALTDWRHPDWLYNHIALLARDEPFGFARALTWDGHCILRVLFAINGAWEPSWKWARHCSRNFALLPRVFHARLSKIYGGAPALARVRLALGLMRDTLALVPPSIDVTQARANIEKMLANFPQE